MVSFRRAGIYLLLTAVGCVSYSLPALSQTSPVAADRAQAAGTQRDGMHDFDFKLGVWKTRIKRVLNPLSGSTKSIELSGTVTVQKIWDGRAALEKIEADGPNGHFQGLTLFLYNSGSHQWNQIFVNSKGVMQPPLIGGFRKGRGELFSQDSVDGKAILVRSVWSGITPEAHRYEESYSDNGGKTWAPAFIATLTRVK